MATLTKSHSAIIDTNLYKIMIDVVLENQLPANQEFIIKCDDILYDELNHDYQINKTSIKELVFKYTSKHSQEILQLFYKEFFGVDNFEIADNYDRFSEDGTTPTMQDVETLIINKIAHYIYDRLY